MNSSSYSKNRHMGSVLWRLTRPHTLTASITPVLIGTVLAIPYAQIDGWLFLAMLGACLMIQIATNLFNEYYDFKRGLDTKDSIGIGGAIVRDGFKPKTVLYLALSMYGLALLTGIYICARSSWWLALIGLLGMLVGYLYTGGPLPIAYTPFGELLAGVLMGSMFILIAFFIQTGRVNLTSILISVPSAVLVGGLNMANNIRDREGDKRAGRRTLAILLGHDRAVLLLGAMFGVAYVWVLALLPLNEVTPWILLVFLSLSKPIEAIRGFAGKSLPIQMMPAMKATSQTNTWFGFLLALGLFLSYSLK